MEEGKGADEKYRFAGLGHFLGDAAHGEALAEAGSAHEDQQGFCYAAVGVFFGKEADGFCLPLLLRGVCAAPLTRFMDPGLLPITFFEALTTALATDGLQEQRNKVDTTAAKSTKHFPIFYFPKNSAILK